METWTIQKLLNWITAYFTEKGVDAARLKAEMLLSSVLSLKRIELYTRFDKPVEKSQLDQLHALTKRAAQSEPVAYLIGKTEFYSMQLDISPDCLIPRPETELLVERAIEFLRSRTAQSREMQDTLQQGRISETAGDNVQLVCDLCTGSGCIAAAIAANFANAKIIATDISDPALKIAAANIKKHNLEKRITLLHGDLFDPIIQQLDTAQFDLVVSNPPYVSASEFAALDKNVKDYEPRIALFAGDDGLDIYRRIIEKIDLFLKPDGAMMLEIGYAQGHALTQLIEQTGVFTDIKIEKDINNNDRILTAAKTPT
ncbi:MAG: peptide chain release factor N(5)-glutamine methyltransferase [Sedimentisphaerales bacterium]|nr:peptide chain release factor N(5)-glutamine methyltransferase [Sedimentisphaerales bacterium]